MNDRFRPLSLGLIAVLFSRPGALLANGESEPPALSATSAAGASASEAASTEEIPDSVAECLAQGRRFAEFHQFELALPLLQKAVDINPMDVEARVTLGGALIEEVEMELLSQARLKAGSQAPAPGTAASTVKGEGVTSIKLNDAQALGRAVRSVELTPPLADRITRGEQDILVALKLDKRENREALSWMGRIEFIRQDWVKARRSFTAILRMNTADIEGGRWLKETEYQATAKRMRERDEAEKKAKEEADAKEAKKKKKK